MIPRFSERTCSRSAAHHAQEARYAPPEAHRPRSCNEALRRELRYTGGDASTCLSVEQLKISTGSRRICRCREEHGLQGTPPGCRGPSTPRLRCGLCAICCRGRCSSGSSASVPALAAQTAAGQEALARLPALRGSPLRLLPLALTPSRILQLIRDTVRHCW